jgi:hypothetical protein
MQVKKLSKSPVREPPPCSPNRVCMERDASSPEAVGYSLIYIRRSPQKGALPRNAGKTYSHRPRRPTQTEGLRTLGCGLVPKGDR